MLIRPMVGDDALMPFLIVAMDWRDQGSWTAQSIRNTPDVAHYVDGWMREGDAGFIAEADGRPLGAAWWRTFASDDKGYGYVATDIPEIGLAVRDDSRGRGVGTALLDTLIAHARDQGLRGVSLSVEDGNDAAIRLYMRYGFERCGRDGNSDTMVLYLAQSEGPHATA